MKQSEGDMMVGNAAVVRRVVESIWNRGDLTLADRLFAPAYVNHGGVIPDLVHGPEAIKISVSLYRTAFPGLVITIDHLEADEDMVELGWAAHSSPRDLPLRAGQASQGETLTGTTRSRLTEGQIVESWTTWDREAAMRRLAMVAEMHSGTGPDVSPQRADG